ncbi:MAG: ubiquinol-cytochrome C reductase [Nitrospinae bacterium RIFCSPLOWO2_12_FULL_47_7]|nr:MAG: ubiquinol-cytochrome C reductase [Nitrospinae bacterium RIFCSPLOWO2_12_FULL_47_7]
MKFWLVKQEPTKYNWEQLLEDKETAWDGVRNFQARNNLKAMKKSDILFFYHSVIGKEIKGVAEVSKEFYPDSTDPRWVAVNIKPVKTLNRPVSLDDIKNHPRLENISLIKQSRLSVMPLSAQEFKDILEMGRTHLKGV